MWMSKQKSCVFVLQITKIVSFANPIEVIMEPCTTHFPPSPKKEKNMELHRLIDIFYFLV